MLLKIASLPNINKMPIFLKSADAIQVSDPSKQSFAVKHHSHCYTQMNFNFRRFYSKTLKPRPRDQLKDFSVMKIVHYARLTKLRQLSEIEFICQFVAP